MLRSQICILAYSFITFIAIGLLTSFPPSVEAQSNVFGDDGCYHFLSLTFCPSNVNTNSNQNPFNTNTNNGGTNNTGGTGSNYTTGSNADLRTGQGILTALGTFLNTVLIPLLFAIALLVFLVNAARFFIIGGANQDSQEKAKRLMIYGIAAFVLLVSIWGIVNTVVAGLKINQTVSLCPDYLGDWCGNEGTPPGSGGYTGGNNGGTGGNNNGGNNGGNGTSTPLISSLAQLLYGTYADSPSLNFTQGAPRAAQNVPNISSTAACTSALNTLRLASEVENAETAYVLYTDSNGITRWQNVTDVTFLNGVGYDADTITGLIAAGATDLYLIHTHQKDNAENAGIIPNGYSPSRKDMELTCDPVVDDLTHVVIDATNVWVMSQPTGSCPRSTAQLGHLAVIEVLAQLSQVTPGDRNQEYADFMNSNVPPSALKDTLLTYKTTNFSSMSVAQILALSNSNQTAAGLTLTRTDAATFCFGL